MVCLKFTGDHFSNTLINILVLKFELTFNLTVSDVWGQILPIVGFMYAQTGVAELYSLIRDNGYKIMYLTARPVGQVKKGD